VITGLDTEPAFAYRVQIRHGSGRFAGQPCTAQPVLIFCEILTIRRTYVGSPAECTETKLA
jgi:hypothetical protein